MCLERAGGSSATTTYEELNRERKKRHQKQGPRICVTTEGKSLRSLLHRNFLLTLNKGSGIQLSSLNTGGGSGGES